MSMDRMQGSRFELKYVISEQKARQIRKYVGSFLELDEFGVGKPQNSYAVHSLYVDSDELKTYWDTVNGNKNRFKLRIRYYSDQPGTPIFLEIKRRMNNCIQKQRVGLVREAAYLVLRGQLPSPDMMLGHEPKHFAALHHFCQHVQEMQAKPKMHIAYLREAYLPSDNNAARVTMDRLVRSEPDPRASLRIEMVEPICVWGDAVVLELKFTDRYPNWFRDLVCTFDLRQCGAAKYADGVSLLKGRPSHHRNAPVNGNASVGPECRPGHALDPNGQPKLRWLPLGEPVRSGRETALDDEDAI